MFMSENPSMAKQEVKVEQELIDQARNKLVEECKKSLAIYTNNGTTAWINANHCKDLIYALENRKPVKVEGRLWMEILNEILYELELNPYDASKKYDAVWKAIEEGK